jgi:hypothetical protein
MSSVPSPFDPKGTGPGWTVSNSQPQPPAFSFKPVFLPVTVNTPNGFSYTFSDDYFLDDASAFVLAGLLGASGVKRVPVNLAPYVFNPSTENYLVFPKGVIDAGMVAYHFAAETDPLVALAKAKAEVAPLL